MIWSSSCWNGHKRPNCSNLWTPTGLIFDNGSRSSTTIDPSMLQTNSSGEIEKTMPENPSPDGDLVGKITSRHRNLRLYRLGQPSCIDRFLAGQILRGKGDHDKNVQRTCRSCI